MPYKDPRVVQLGTLEPGTRFQLAEQEKTGTLLYSTPGRARVKYDKQFVDLSTDYAIDIGFSTMVIPLAGEPS